MRKFNSSHHQFLKTAMLIFLLVAGVPNTSYAVPECDVGEVFGNAEWIELVDGRFGFKCEIRVFTFSNFQGGHSSPTEDYAYFGRRISDLNVEFYQSFFLHTRDLILRGDRPQVFYELLMSDEPRGSAGRSMLTLSLQQSDDPEIGQQLIISTHHPRILASTHEDGRTQTVSLGPGADFMFVETYWAMRGRTIGVTLYDPDGEEVTNFALTMPDSALSLMPSETRVGLVRVGPQHEHGSTMRFGEVELLLTPMTVVGM